MATDAIPAGQELRSTDKPIYGSTAVTINNTVYIYGGYYAVSPWNMEALWSLPSRIDSLEQVPTDPYASPALIYGQMVSPSDRTLYTFGGHHPVDPLNTSLPPEPLRYYRFSFDTLTWTPLQKQTLDHHPLERYWHSVVMSPERDKAYLFGGMNVTGPLDDVFWMYTFQTDQWTRIPLDGAVTARCGHTASMLR